MDLQFERDFLFGASTAAYQIEGGWNEDGKGLSTWDVFAHTKGKMNKGHTGDVACDTYHNFQTDVDIMDQLNLDVYRFSISWPRVLPEGKGKINEAGLDYYKRLIDSLLEKGIRPFVTLFHWDTPYALFQECKGFMGRDTAYYFADYARKMAEQLGDRVKDWITLNEPWEHAFAGHFDGYNAPGLKSPWAYFKVAHHELLGHGLALQSMRSVRDDLNLGITLSQFPVYAADYDRNDKDTAAIEMTDMFMNRFFLDSIFKGKYPEKMMKKLRIFMPKIKEGDLEIINQPMDYLGINYYNRVFARPKWYIPFFGTWVEGDPKDERYHHPELGYLGYPDGMLELARRYRDEYGNPIIYITENGTAEETCVQEMGLVHDPYRIRFMELYLEAVKKAVDEGCNIKGYFYWSLLDNLEWNAGYTHPMGLLKVDYETQERTIRDSAYWYRDLINSQISRK